MPVHGGAEGGGTGSRIADETPVSPSALGPAAPYSRSPLASVDVEREKWTLARARFPGKRLGPSGGIRHHLNL